MENTQPTGSFKLRGIGLMCQRAVEQGKTHLICPSGGNAGFAAALAGAKLKTRTSIIVPETTPEFVRTKISAFGAKIIVHGKNWDEANLEAVRLCDDPDAVYVPPFDHPDIWEGHASMIDEAILQAQDMSEKFDAVICSVGGGGLLCGVLTGLHRNNCEDVPVIAVETTGTASFNAAMAVGKPVSLSSIDSMATSLAAKRVASTAIEWTQRHLIHSVLVSDLQAINACQRFADDMRALVEPACGAALAVIYNNFEILKPFKCPLLIVCGGVGVDLNKLAEWSN